MLPLKQLENFNHSSERSKGLEQVFPVFILEYIAYNYMKTFFIKPLATSEA